MFLLGHAIVIYLITSTALINIEQLLAIIQLVLHTMDLSLFSYDKNNAMVQCLLKYYCLSAVKLHSFRSCYRLAFLHEQTNCFHQRMNLLDVSSKLMFDTKSSMNNKVYLWHLSLNGKLLKRPCSMVNDNIAYLLFSSISVSMNLQIVDFTGKFKHYVQFLK